MKKFMLFFILRVTFANAQCSTVYGVVNTGRWSVVSVDKYTGTYSPLDTISSLSSLVEGTTTIESDSDRYAMLGMDSVYIQHIYTIDLNTGKVLYQPVCNSNLSEVHYDIKQKKMFALLARATISSTYQWFLVTINPYNGNLNILDSITGMRYFGIRNYYFRN